MSVSSWALKGSHDISKKHPQVLPAAINKLAIFLWSTEAKDLSSRIPSVGRTARRIACPATPWTPPSVSKRVHVLLTSGNMSTRLSLPSSTENGWRNGCVWERTHTQGETFLSLQAGRLVTGMERKRRFRKGRRKDDAKLQCNQSGSQHESHLESLAQRNFISPEKRQSLFFPQVHMNVCHGIYLNKWDTVRDWFIPQKIILPVGRTFWKCPELNVFFSFWQLIKVRQYYSLYVARQEGDKTPGKHNVLETICCV